MNWTTTFEKRFKQLLPTPFTIAIILTLITFIISIVIKEVDDTRNIVEIWYQGLWQSNLLAFTVQMMLMLVLGHSLALTSTFNSFINTITKYTNTNAKSAWIVCLLTIIIGYFNWGLSLIFGAILAQKVALNANKKNIKINYPLIGACGYVGLLVWHGGISGSAPLKANEINHLKTISNITSERIEQIPNIIDTSLTIFSTMNIVSFILIVSLLPVSMYFIGRKNKNVAIPKSNDEELIINNELKKVSGMEKLDYASIFSKSLGLLLISITILKATVWNNGTLFSILTPNYINFTLLSLCLLLHKNIFSFLNSTEQAIKGTTGILIQFPLYFGIMALITQTGIGTLISESMISLSTNSFLSPEKSLPILTLISSAIVNVFVPSGGGQWSIQAPLIIESCLSLKVSLAKTIMAMSYGDQLTNMLQPFWALPLLGITKLKAKDILPYTLLLMIIAGSIYILVLLIF